MKKTLLPILTILLVLQGFSQTPVALTFQAKDSLTQNALALDSVKVTNLTEYCDTTVYGAVSVLNVVALWPVGIQDPATGSSESFSVMQNTQFHLDKQQQRKFRLVISRRSLYY